MGTHVLCLFTRPAIAICLFVYCIEGNIVCPRPPLPKNSWSSTNEEFFEVNRTFFYECRRRHYLFGNDRRLCLPNGQWSGETPYCAGENKNVKLKEKKPEFAVLLDGWKTTCLLTSLKSLHKPIYLTIGGIHSLAIVMVIPDHAFSLMYEVSYYDYSSQILNYKDLSSYIQCVKDSQREAFKCDFHKPLENPKIRITLGEHLKSCASCNICEVVVFTKEKEPSECLPPKIAHARWNTSYSTHPIGTMLTVECKEGYELSSNTKSITCRNDGQWPILYCMAKNFRHCTLPQTEHAYWNNPNDSYPVEKTFEVECEGRYEFSSTSMSVMCNKDGKWPPLNCTEIQAKGTNMATIIVYVLPAAILTVLSLSVAIAVAVVLKKRKNKRTESEKQADCQVEREDQHEQVSEHNNYSNYTATNECTYNNNKECESGKQTDSQKEQEEQCVQIIEDGYIIPSEVTYLNLNTPELQPVYVNELIPFSNSTHPLSDEAGYLVPTNSRRAPSKDKNEIGNVYWEDDEMTIYCSIPEVTPQQYEANTSNLYANI